MADEKKPDISSENKESILNIKMRALDGDVNFLFFLVPLKKNFFSQNPLEIRAKKTTKVSRLISAWAENKGISPNSIRLFLDGTRLSADKNLEEVMNFLKRQAFFFKLIF